MILIAAGRYLSAIAGHAAADYEYASGSVWTLTNLASRPRVRWAFRRILKVRPRMAPYIAFASRPARMPLVPTLALVEVVNKRILDLAVRSVHRNRLARSQT